MKILTVSEINAQIKSLLEATFVQVYVSGEVSNCTYHSSGHVYFSLKDKDCALKCVLFRGNARKIAFRIENGMNLNCHGAISVFSPRGEYQLNCFSIEPSGVGALALAYEQLKQDYEAKGYFDKQKPLPQFPSKVALITSSTGAVLHDMLRIAQKRWNLVSFTLFDTKVQGEGAKEEIARHIAWADELGFDCIVLARGGGSIEDLWAFNESEVLESIYRAQTPIISAIGHEPDVVLSDFVADCRAPTPSGAMEILLPDKNEWLMLLDGLCNRFDRHIADFLRRKQQQLEQLFLLIKKNSYQEKITHTEKLLCYQRKLLVQKMEQRFKLFELLLAPLKELLAEKSDYSLKIAQSKLHLLKEKLESKNPSHFSKQGYVFALHNQKPIKTLCALKKHQTIILQDYSAQVKAIIDEVKDYQIQTQKITKAR